MKAIAMLIISKPKSIVIHQPDRSMSCRRGTPNNTTSASAIPGGLFPNVTTTAKNKTTTTSSSQYVARFIRPWRREFIFASEPELVIGWLFAEFGRAFPVRHAVEQSIHKGRLFAAEEDVRDVEIFIDHDLCRHVRARHQFVNSGTKNRAQDRVDALQLPVFGQVLRNGAIDFHLMMRHTAHEIGEELRIRLAGAGFGLAKAMVAELLCHGFRIGARQFHLVDRLHRGQTRRMSLRM